jgi:acetyl esterase/lipase
MNKAFVFVAALALAGGGSLAGRAAQATSEQTIAYGQHQLQRLDFSRAQGSRDAAPLVLFVHGGGWSRGSKDNATGRDLGPHLNALGYNFATINYRLVPDATVEDQARDVAAAVRALADRADTLGIDRRRIVLAGHSAGAHLVALVGTDPQYLRSAGLSTADIAGIVPIDGAGYDVPSQMSRRQPLTGKMFRQAFGDDPARQQALSPTRHAERPNVTNFLILYVEREDGAEQSEALGAALERAGTKVELAQFPGRGLRGHMKINRSLGDPDYPATATLDAWLERVFAG